MVGEGVTTAHAAVGVLVALHVVARARLGVAIFVKSVGKVCGGRPALMPPTGDRVALHQPTTVGVEEVVRVCRQIFLIPAEVVVSNGAMERSSELSSIRHLQIPVVSFVTFAFEASNPRGKRVCGRVQARRHALWTNAVPTARDAAVNLFATHCFRCGGVFEREVLEEVELAVGAIQTPPLLPNTGQAAQLNLAARGQVHARTPEARSPPPGVCDRRWRGICAVRQ